MKTPSREELEHALDVAEDVGERVSNIVVILFFAGMLAIVFGIPCMALYALATH